MDLKAGDRVVLLEDCPFIHFATKTLLKAGTYARVVSFAPTGSVYINQWDEASRESYNAIVPKRNIKKA